MEHWDLLLSSPLWYLSVAFRRSRREYYEGLAAVRTEGDWEGWTSYFLRCVHEAAEDAVGTAHRLFRLLADDRQRFLQHDAATLSAVRLLDLLPDHPMITLADGIELLGLTKPTANKAIAALRAAGILHEVSGKRRNRVYSYDAYLKVLSEGTETAPG
ncbi:MAG: Fic family protein [Thermoguttaceae bacterium]